MKRTVSLFEFMPYGAPELLASSRPHLVRALLLGSISATLVFLAAWPLLSRMSLEVRVIELPPSPFSITPAELLPPPDLDPAEAPPRAANPDQGVVMPVPDAPERPAIDFTDDPAPAQPGDLSPGTSDAPIVIPGGSGAEIVETLPERGETRPVDDLPAEIVQYKPEYPSIARDAGVEGLVVVHALIGKDGRVIRAEVDAKHSIPLLDETARAAALRWVFTPAYYRGRPVPVWYAIPFRFVLNDPGR